MIKLVPLKSEYCEQVYEIARECLPEHWSLDGIRDVLKYDNNIYYVAVECIDDAGNDKVVGFGGIMIVADEAELLNIAVRDKYRHQGIASSLIDTLLNEAEKAGAYRMLLEVREHNDAAGKLYAKHGFTVLGSRKNYYSDPVDNAVIMEIVFDNI